ncbi:MAG: PAS domain S-box protein [Bdellovibrio sp.]|nr:PAS domain S-box protein [Bdellovibrio sp.]
MIKKKSLSKTHKRGALKGPKSKKKKISFAKNFPIVGIGASAGGLEAFQQLLENLPADTGMAFVFIQHLAPSHESLGPEILSHYTDMPVQEVLNGIRPLPNQVYLLPPNSKLTLVNGVLCLLPRSKILSGQQTVIDSFFQSLAQDQKDRAIGIVLSGTASDGSEGLKAIKAEGGVAMAQELKSAKYDGMPTSAIASGVVDIILPPAGIAQELVRIAKHPYIASLKKRAEVPEPDEVLHKIFALLLKSTKVDFSNYKHATLKRRIERRMMVRQTKDLDAYASYLQEHPEEIEALFGDILINVTEFFRDPKSFKALTDRIFPSLMKRREARTPIRIWVPGCSTGEEVYSLAILLLEFLGDASTRKPIQIFATDISEQVLQVAREGVYSVDIESTVSKQRLEKFFSKIEKGYKIRKEIRELCLFSKHDMTRDPPFSKIDLVSCRNVLIYFAPVLQKRVLSIFHYALNPGGFIWLGKSEGTGQLSKLFTPVDKFHKFYRKINVPSPAISRFPINRTWFDTQGADGKIPARVKSMADFLQDADRLALSKYAPPFVVVNSEMEILQFRGRTAPYLEPASGLPSANLFKMARQDLVHALRMMFHATKKGNKPIRREGLPYEVDGTQRSVNIEVIPVNPVFPPDQQNFVIFFEEASIPKKGARKIISNDQEERINQLEHDFAESKQYQQIMADEFAATQEELTSANEELQSTNEELQSTNEELETAKEELQSSNEELITVNDEMQKSNSELLQLSSDLNNLLSTVEIPILIVGNDHRIRKFTPAAEKIFNLVPSDIGRPIKEITPIFNHDLDSLVSEVIESLHQQQKELQDYQGKWLRLQIRPYKTTENRIDGAVISLIDIDLLKKNLAYSKSQLDYARSIADTVQLPLVVLDQNLRVMSANESFLTSFHLTSQEYGKDFFSILMGPNWPISSLRKAMTEVLADNTIITNYEIEYDFPRAGYQILLLSARQIDWIGIEKKAMLVSLDNITERRKAERELKISEQKFHDLLDAAVDAILCTDKDGKIVFANKQVKQWFGHEPQEVIGRPIDLLIPQSDWQQSHVKIASENMAGTGRELMARRKDESLFPVEISLSHTQTPDGLLITGIIRDISDRKKMEKERAELLNVAQTARGEAERANQAKDIFLATLSHELRTPLTAILLWSQMLSMKKLDEQKSTMAIEMIVQSSKILGKLIDDLLDISRILSGKLSLKFLALDLAPIIQDTIESLDIMTKNKAIRINLTVEPSIGLVSADSIRIHQIMWNLLNNAIKFSPEKSEIQVKLKKVLRPSGAMAQIQVIDNGIGIASNFLPHLFERFTQADNSKTRIHDGLGLGLAIVRNLVELHGGTIQAESPGLGKGSTFTLNLPILPLAKKTKAQNDPIKELQSLVLDGLRVLLVEDEVTTREALTIAIQSFGAKVQTASSVKEALELFPKFRPQVLVSDVAIPIEDGHSLMRKIRDLSALKGGQTPSLALTAYATEEDVKKALAAGFTAYLSKPVDIDTLIKMIARLAER